VTCLQFFIIVRYQIIDVRRTFAPEPKQPARFKKSQKHELASSSTETADKM
jgi:hypothetical protein